MAKRKKPPKALPTSFSFLVHVSGSFNKDAEDGSVINADKTKVIRVLRLKL